MKPEEESDHNQKVKAVFEGAASRYDLLNRLMSLGIDKRWRRKTAQLIEPSGKKIIDLCAGTGDLSLELLRQGDSKTEIIASDFSNEMLSFGKNKAQKFDKNKQIKFILEDATSINLADESVDAATVAFGIRNIEKNKRLAALKEFYRVTRRGGMLACLEFAHPPNKIINKIYFAYLLKIIPFIASLISKKPSSYLYLADSIQKFPNQKDFADLITKAGWSDVKFHNLTWGIVAIHSGIKDKEIKKLQPII